MFKFFRLKPKREKVIPFEHPIKVPQDRLTIRSINTIFPEPKGLTEPKVKIV